MILTSFPKSHHPWKNQENWQLIYINLEGTWLNMSTWTVGPLFVITFELKAWITYQTWDSLVFLLLVTHNQGPYSEQVNNTVKEHLIATS